MYLRQFWNKNLWYRDLLNKRALSLCTSLSMFQAVYNSSRTANSIIMVHFSFRRLKEQQDFFIYNFILLKSFLLVFTINFASRLSTLMKANENGSSLNDAGLNNASSPAVRLPLRLRLAVEALPFVLRPRSANTSLVDS